jgi:hypothetical protein
MPSRLTTLRGILLIFWSGAKTVTTEWTTVKTAGTVSVALVTQTSDYFPQDQELTRGRLGQYLFAWDTAEIARNARIISQQRRAHNGVVSRPPKHQFHGHDAQHTIASKTHAIKAAQVGFDCLVR